MTKKKLSAASIFMICLSLSILLLTGCGGRFSGAAGDAGLKKDSYADFIYDNRVRAFAAERGYDIKEIKSVEILSSNNGEVARAGSAISFFARITARTEDGTETVIDFGDVELTELDGMTALTDNCVAVTGSEKAALTVKFFIVAKSFSYTVRTQDTGYDNYTLLVNKFSFIGDDYRPDDLRVSDVISYRHAAGSTVNQLRMQALYALEEMCAAAGNAGYTICSLSGYRPYDMQQRLYDSAGGTAQNGTAAPGASEHQTGLCMDVTWESAGYSLTQSMQYQPEYAWLAEHCCEYGFVLRYPKGCDEITGYKFEPWHYRYIGREAAAAYKESGVSTLDEFLSFYDVN